MAPWPPPARSPPPHHAVAGTTAISGSGAIPRDIPLEIVSKEEMALIDAAMASASCLPRALSSCCPRGAASSPPPPAVASLWHCTRSLGSGVQLVPSQEASSQDVEDSGIGTTPSKSPLQLFRSKRALSVTNVTTMEWCEKQTAFVLLYGKPQRTKAMEAGSEHHAELEEEHWKIGTLQRDDI